MSSEVEKSRRVYQVLGLRDFAATDEIKKAYRELALLHHPDKNRADPDAAEKFKEINAAYQVLSNEQRRASYDALLSTTGRRDATSGSGGGAGFARSASHYQEELNQFRAQRRAQSSGAGARGAASHTGNNAPTGAGATQQQQQQQSQYSAEQTEMFRRREKERERELARRLEREREERRDKDLDRVRRMQQQREKDEERRKREQDKLRDKIDRIFTGTGSGGATTAASGPARRASSQGRAPTTPTASTRSSTFAAASPTSSAAPHTVPSAADDGAATAAASSASTAAAADRARREKERQDEARLQEQQKQLDKRLKHIRAAEEQRAAEEREEREAAFARRAGEIEKEEEQERGHFIAPQESHDRNRIVAQLRKLEAAYRRACEQQALAEVEAGARRDLALGRMLWCVEAELWRRQSAARYTIVGEWRSERDALSRTFAQRDRALGHQHAQRQALLAESIRGRNAVVAREGNARDRIGLEWVQAKVRAILHQRQAKELAALREQYWASKVVVCFERDMVKQRRRIASECDAASARIRLAEIEGRRRAALLHTEVVAFIALARERGACMADIHATQTHVIENLQLDLERIRRTEASTRADVSALQRRIEQMAAAHADELSTVTAARDNAALKLEAKIAESTARIESLERQRDRALGETSFLQEKLDAAECERDEQRDRAAMAEALSNRPTADAAAATTNSVASTPGSERRRARSGIGTPSSAAADTDAATIAALRKKVLALEALVEHQKTHNSEAGASTPARTATPSSDVGAASASNKELVALLCAENKRLLEANAQLLSENRRLAVAGGDASTPPPQSPSTAEPASASRQSHQTSQYHHHNHNQFARLDSLGPSAKATVVPSASGESMVSVTPRRHYTSSSNSAAAASPPPEAPSGAPLAALSPAATQRMPAAKGLLASSTTPTRATTWGHPAAAAPGTDGARHVARAVAKSRAAGADDGASWYS